MHQGRICHAYKYRFAHEHACCRAARCASSYTCRTTYIACPRVIANYGALQVLGQLFRLGLLPARHHAHVRLQAADRVRANLIGQPAPEQTQRPCWKRGLRLKEVALGLLVLWFEGSL